MNHVWATAKYLKPYLVINDIAVFIFPPITFDFGIEMLRLYCVVARIPDFEYLIVGSSLFYCVF